jgi:beta-1,4-mannosyl-glycoprotein beta-1,4-N-acetylglucosaminyltransferase
MKIIDCFIFFNEIDLLKFRLEYLNDEVDNFVIVESNRTFTNIEKITHVDKLKLNDKVCVKIVKDSPQDTDAWGREKHQRNEILSVLETMNLDDEDIIIISDVDEIPDIRAVRELRKKSFEILSFEMDFYYYNLTCKNIKKCLVTKAMKYKFLKEQIKCVNEVRYLHIKRPIPTIKNGGWHFSYFSNKKKILEKIESFSHQEYNNNLYKNKISTRIKNGKDLFFRKEDWQYVNPKNNAYLPEKIYQNKKIFFNNIIKII